MASYGYEEGMCPIAERASAEVVNLPLHPRANESTAQRTVDFIARIGPADPA
jgi:dTDP-4-amino-4,6-dideoxygalactose transaminase